MKTKMILLILLSFQMARAEVACENKVPFTTWLTEFKTDAVSQGVLPATLEQVASYLVFNPEVIKRDRSQSVFQQTFLEFSDRMANEQRRKKAQLLLKTTYKDLFSEIEKKFKVPPEPLLAFWALESDFGSFTGKFQIISSVITLAYDCRRADKFRAQAISALKLVQRGDIAADEMIGNWAGELGGTQFMASDYLKLGYDFDGDGKVNLVKSIPDTLASAANFLKDKNWKLDEPWMQEVLVPEKLNWLEADITIKHPVARWADWGVKPVQGTFKDSTLLASLILPMGRLGPAFLVYPNFNAFLAWNESMVYSTTAAFFATRIAGAPPMQRGTGEIKNLNAVQMLELQNLLIKRNLNPGVADGKLGSATRTAVRIAQQSLGLPPDGYPTLEVLEALRK